MLIDAGKPESRSLCVYSTADGHEQRCWQTTDLSTFYLGPTSYLPGRLYPALTWIDDDRGLAFGTLSGNRETVRRLDLSAPGTDLMADSQAAEGGGAPVVDHRVTEPAWPATGPLTAVPPSWVDPTGTALLAEWNFLDRSASTVRVVTDFGLIRNGRLTPLPVPAGAASGNQAGRADGNLAAIAW